MRSSRYLHCLSYALSIEMCTQAPLIIPMNALQREEKKINITKQMHFSPGVFVMTKLKLMSTLEIVSLPSQHPYAHLLKHDHHVHQCYCLLLRTLNNIHSSPIITTLQQMLASLFFFSFFVSCCFSCYRCCCLHFSCWCFLCNFKDR